MTSALTPTPGDRHPLNVRLAVTYQKFRKLGLLLRLKALRNRGKGVPSEPLPQAKAPPPPAAG